MHHIHHTELRRFELQRIDIDHDLAIRAAVGLRNRSSGDVRDLVAHCELRHILELRLIHACALERNQANRKIGSVEAQHNRWQGPGRQTAQVGHREIRNVADCCGWIGARLEINLDEADTGHGARLDVIDVAAQREEALIAVRNVGLDLLRRHARVERGNDNHWNLNWRKEIDGHADNGSNAHHDDGQTDHKNEIGITDRKEGHGLFASLLWSALILDKVARSGLWSNSL